MSNNKTDLLNYLGMQPAFDRNMSIGSLIIEAAKIAAIKKFFVEISKHMISIDPEDIYPGNINLGVNVVPIVKKPLGEVDPSLVCRFNAYYDACVAFLDAGGSPFDL